MDPRMPLQRIKFAPNLVPITYENIPGAPRASTSQIRFNRRTLDYEFPKENSGVVTDGFMHKLITKHLDVEPFNSKYDEMMMMPMVFLLTAGRYLIDEDTIIDEDKCHVTTMAEVMAPVMPDRLYVPQDEARERVVEIVKFLIEECRCNRINHITTAKDGNFKEWFESTYDQEQRAKVSITTWPAPGDQLTLEQSIIILKHMSNYCFVLPLRYRTYLALHVYASLAKQGQPTPTFIKCIRVYTLLELKVDMEYNLDHIRMFFNTYKRYFIRSNNDEILVNVCKRCRQLISFRQCPKLIQAMEDCLERKYSGLR